MVQLIHVVECTPENALRAQ